MQEIEYFYSAHSAYAYFGSALFMKIAAAAGRRIVHKPVDLDRVLQGCASTAFKERSVAYRNYFFNREMERWVQYRGIPHLGHRPTRHHHSPDLANRMLIAAIGAGRNVDRLAHRMLEGHWAEDADLGDPDTLVALAAAVGEDGETLLGAARDKPAVDAYDANTREAIARSVFGSPTYFVDGDMFYGQDRLELVERALREPFADTWPAIGS
jgi:2-hydroxychromene-2-carboxylate isomerase